MASEHRHTKATRSAAAILATCALGCTSQSGVARPFPLRAPLTRDTDLQSVDIACRKEPTKKDPHHVSCAPAMYVSPLAWDGLDNSIFRPLARVFAVAKSRESLNANSLDEVADSSWFTNRLGARPVSVEELKLGACERAQFIDGDHAADGSWVVDQGKEDGSTPGFRVNIPGKGKYLLKADDKTAPERTTAASVIGAAAYNAVGFFTSCEQVVYFKPSVLKLTPGLHSEDNSGAVKAFDEKALARVLASSTKRGERVRMQASAWLPGRLIGPFRYLTTRADDPNDVIRHQDRRELRGGRLLAAWLDHFDAREENTMDVWFADKKEQPESSPGQVRHYYLDTSDCLGSEWAWNGISRRLGYSYLLDWGDISLAFVQLGIPLRTWDRIERTPGEERFGYFNIRDFVADSWKNEYPNPAFTDMTERDGAWMARKLARVTHEMVLALADMGDFEDPVSSAFLARTLQGRLDKILERYLTRLSPVADVHVVGTDRLCATDLLEARGTRVPESFHDSARLLTTTLALPVDRKGKGQMCMSLPHVQADGGLPDDAKERYVRVAIGDGVARGLLIVHLYDLGPSRGYRLVGLERPEP
jgi:hypothetical protein